MIFFVHEAPNKFSFGVWRSLKKWQCVIWFYFLNHFYSLSFLLLWLRSYPNSFFYLLQISVLTHCDKKRRLWILVSWSIAPIWTPGPFFLSFISWKFIDYGEKDCSVFITLLSETIFMWVWCVLLFKKRINLWSKVGLPYAFELIFIRSKKLKQTHILFTIQYHTLYKNQNVLSPCVFIFIHWLIGDKKNCILNLHRTPSAEHFSLHLFFIRGKSSLIKQTFFIWLRWIGSHRKYSMCM